MAFDFTVTWQFSQSKQLFFILIKLHAQLHFLIYVEQVFKKKPLEQKSNFAQNKLLCKSFFEQTFYFGQTVFCTELVFEQKFVGPNVSG
jgi:hypothetical protein